MINQIRIDFIAGTAINDAVVKALSIVHRTGINAIFGFNGVSVSVNRGDLVRDIIQRYDLDIAESNIGQMRNMEDIKFYTKEELQAKYKEQGFKTKFQYLRDKED